MTNTFLISDMTNTLSNNLVASIYVAFSGRNYFVFFFLVNRESNINYEVLLQEPKGTILVRAVPSELANKKGITTGGGELKRLQTEDILAPNLAKASAQQLLCSLYHIAFILLVW